MGFYIHYQAMPEGSRLFRRLRSDWLLCAMYGECIHRPAGPFDIAQLPPDELNGYLDEIAANPLFGLRQTAERAFADLQAELARANREYPGLARRSAYFELSYFDDRVANALARAGAPNGREFARAIFLGTEPFPSDSPDNDYVELQLLPPRLVAEAASRLSKVGPEEISGWEKTFPAFRCLYVEAAARGEAVVIAA